MARGKKSVVVDALLVEADKIAHLPNDSARFAYVVLLGKGKFQDVPGRFASRAHGVAVLGAYGKWFDALVKVGLVETEDDHLVVHAWDEWQTNSTPRVQRHRASQRAGNGQ